MWYKRSQQADQFGCRLTAAESNPDVTEDQIAAQTVLSFALGYTNDDRCGLGTKAISVSPQGTRSSQSLVSVDRGDLVVKRSFLEHLCYVCLQSMEAK